MKSPPSIVEAPVGSNAKLQWRVNGHSSMDTITIRKKNVNDVILFIYGHGKNLTMPSIQPYGDAKNTFGCIILGVEADDSGIYQLVHEDQILTNANLIVYGECKACLYLCI